MSPDELVPVGSRNLEDLGGSAAGDLRRETLLRWFAQKSRAFPWREYTSAWHVLLAEMLLVRTRADIVGKHIADLIERFPTPESMATTELAVVEEALRPLGLRWRARRLHELSRVVAHRYRGIVPRDLDGLLGLPGVGPYVASATLSKLTGQRVRLTDTNTVRVAKRVAGIALDGDIRRRRQVQDAIAALMNGPAGSIEWLAVLDLGATICVPRDPRCQVCPMLHLCTFGMERIRGGLNGRAPSDLTSVRTTNPTPKR
jgi:A/G-specific adenine glycosylase